jgi:methionyl-tRNA formyltransferase
MRVVLFLNNWGGWQLARWLRKRGDEVVGLVVQRDDGRFAPEIVATVGLPPERVWNAPDLRTPATVQTIRELQPEVGVSGWFGYVFKPELFELFTQGCVNLHAAYLPFNRGWHTNVWPILDGSPAGVTLHYIDAGVDTGDLIAQRRVEVGPAETGGSLHRKLTLEIISLFKDTWPLIVSGRNTRTPQDHSLATRHKRADLDQLDCIDLAREFRGRDLLNLLRARTYPPYPAAYYVANGRRQYIRLNLTEGPPVGGRATAAAPGARVVDLDARYEAGIFLDILRGSDGSTWPACFADAGRTIHVRAELVQEAEIDTSANPPWIGDASAVDSV